MCRKWYTTARQGAHSKTGGPWGLNLSYLCTSYIYMTCNWASEVNPPSYTNSGGIQITTSQPSYETQGSPQATHKRT